MGEWLLGWMPWGVEVIVLAQTLRSGPLDLLMLAVTNLGSSYLYAPAIVFLYWCVDKRLGAGLAYLLLCSSYVNDWVKLALALPRPADPRIVVLQPEVNPSFPSGHAQNSLVVAGYLGAWLRRAWVWVLAAIVVLSISFSRLYLGVHFPQDIAGGWVIGAALLGGSLRLGPRLGRLPLAARLALAVAVPLLLLLIYPAENGALLAGLLLGAGVGFVLEARYVRFTPALLGGPFGSRKARKEHERRGRMPAIAARPWKLMLRLLVGGAAVGLVYLVPSLLVPAGLSGLAASLVRFMRYGLQGFTFAFIAPWLFVRLGLAGKEERSAV